MTTSKPQQPWRVPVARSDVPETGLHLDIAADADIRAALAEIANLRDIAHLEASFDLRPHGADGLHVGGEVRATVGQTCVVTLEPMESDVVEPVDLVFVPQNGTRDVAPFAEDDGSEEPETLVDGAVDLGAIAAEFLILGLDPYPRRPGATFQAPATHEPAGSAFAALAALKTESGKKGG